MATEATTLREMATRFEGYAQMWRCQGRDEDAAAMDQAAALYHRKASDLEAAWRNDDDPRQVPEPDWSAIREQDKQKDV
jgi:hypothetical protein